MKEAILFAIATALTLTVFVGLLGFSVGFVFSLYQGESVGESFRNALGVAWKVAKEVWSNVLTNGPPH